MRNISGPLCLIVVFGIGCKHAGADADPPSTGDVAAESAAPVESEPSEVETPVEPVDPNLCALVEGEWEACDGKLVQIDGENASTIQQHPNLSGPDTEQGYLDVEGVGQIIIITRHIVDCSDAMQVVGTLRRIEENSYQGWVVEHAHFTCR